MMLTSGGAHTARKHLSARARRRSAQMKRNAHRRERHAVRQLLESGTDDIPLCVTSRVTSWDVI